jgi:hypothetical protein
LGTCCRLRNETGERARVRAASEKSRAEEGTDAGLPAYAKRACYFAISFSCKVLHITLPVADFGNVSTNSTIRGTL